MPFTFAHPAAVLPLRGVARLRMVPLIIGAVTPDMPYYVPQRYGHFGPETHSLLGSVSTCVLLGYAALAFVFVLRRPLTALLSAQARWLLLRALAPFGRRPLEWLLAGIAIVIGVWTHLLWDSFTHNDGWVVRRVEVLSAPVSIGDYHGTVCHVLQYVSSVLGLALLVWWYHRLPAAPADCDGAAPRPAVGPVLALVGAAALLIGGVQATLAYEALPVLYHTVYIFLTRTLAWFAALYVLAGVLVTIEQQHAAA